MGKIEYEGRTYIFDWQRILLLFVGAPILAFGIWYSHDWVWLHGISARFTIWLLNIILGVAGTPIASYVTYYAPYHPTPYLLHIVTATGQVLPLISFETLCTGIHAIAIFTGAIVFIPHSKDAATSRDIWLRKGIGVLVTSVIFYLVNILRMILQLALYRNGADWEDVHYPISSASSFIAVACVLVMHKFTPEFIMSLLWIGDELRGLKSKKNLVEIASDSQIPTVETPSSDVIEKSPSSSYTSPSSSSSVDHPSEREE